MANNYRLQYTNFSNDEDIPIIRSTAGSNSTQEFLDELVGALERLRKRAESAEDTTELKEVVNYTSFSCLDNTTETNFGVQKTKKYCLNIIVDGFLAPEDNTEEIDDPDWVDDPDDPDDKADKITIEIDQSGTYTIQIKQNGNVIDSHNFIIDANNLESNSYETFIGCFDFDEGDILTTCLISPIEIDGIKINTSIT